jgi:ABC-2 type transport system permease protein
MKRIINKYRRSWILLKELVRTDFKLRYKGSVLGMVWSVLRPILLFAIMYVVFVRFLRFGEGTPHFAVSLLTATVLWSFFTEATGQGMRSIVDRGDLLRKINFPKYIVVVSATVSALINLVINLAVVVVFAMINGVDFRWSVLLVPILILELYVFALALAFLLSALYVKFRDVQHIWDVLMQGAFYATPIIYPLSMIASINLTAAKVMLMNPVAQIIQDVRYSLITTQTDTVWNFMGNVTLALAPILVVIVCIALASIYFRRNSKKFAEEV